jgi:molecular chaperone DnaJ
MASKRDYYELLGVGRSATQEEIKRAFRRLARRHHPDVNPNDPEAEARFKEIAEAYEVLRDPHRRAQYDHFGHAAPAGAPAGDFWQEFGGFDSIFDAFFGGPRTQRRRGPQRGSDLRYDVEITLEEVASGAERVIRAERIQACDECGATGSRSEGGDAPCPACAGSGQTRRSTATPFGRLSTVTTCGDCGGRGRLVSDPCSHCGGSGRRLAEAEIPVTIPPGVEDGVSVRVEGGGEAGERGAPPGDLYVFVHVKPHEIFERRGRALYCEVPIPFTTAALGGSIRVPTLDGPEQIDIPAGTQTGAVIPVRGKGLPDVRTGVPGSLHVKVRVVTPAKLTERQRQLLTEFAREGGDRVEDEKGWFARFRDALRGED